MDQPLSDPRALRWLETSPDNYVSFEARQRQWLFSYRHPWLWWLYRQAARLRCLARGHEFSPLWEEDKFVPDPKTRTSCRFCGKEKIAPQCGARSSLLVTMERLTALQEVLDRRGQGGKWDVFQSTIEPDRWYVGRRRVAILATEIGAGGEDEARLAAEAVNALPQLLHELAKHQARVEGGR